MGCQSGLPCGMCHNSRNNVHHAFLNNVITCIVATISFEMGIDKGDIRLVVHYGCPKDIESYCQETGRAGRDGQPSQCHVFYSQEDFCTNRYFLKTVNDEGMRCHKQEMIHAIEKYLYSPTCRRAELLSYFGEKLETCHDVCCDNCLGQTSHKSTEIGPEVKLFLNFVGDFQDKYGKTMFINALRGANLAKMPSAMKSSQYYGLGQKREIKWWKACSQHMLNDGLLAEKSIRGNYGSTISISSKGIDWLILNSEPLSPTFIAIEPADKAILSETVKVTKIKPLSTKTNSILSATQQATYALFSSGSTIGEITKSRNLSVSTIEGHLVDAVRYNLEIDFSKLGINKTTYDAIWTAIKSDPLNGDVTKLAPIKALCPAGTTYLEIKLALAIYEAKREMQLTL